MKQNLLKTWLMLVCLLIGAGSAWAEDATIAAGTNGSKAVVNEKDAIKVGASSKGGDMTITVPAGATTLTFYAAAWNGVTGLKLNITPTTNVETTSVALTADTGISGNSPFTLSGSEDDYKFTINLKDVKAETTITLTSSIEKRFVVWGATYTTAGGGSSDPVSVTGVSLDKTSLDLKNGSKAKLLATIAPANASNKNISWKSNNEGVAKVDNGVVTAVSEGTATITATTEDGNYTATCTVNVSPFTITYANTYTSGTGLLSTAGGTSASNAKVKWDEEEYAAIKAGASSTAGVVKINVPAGTKTLHMHIAGWKDEGKEVKVTGAGINEKISINPDAGMANSSPFTLKSDPETNHYYSIDTNNADPLTLTITATTGNRFAIFGVNAEAGGDPDPLPTPTLSFANPTYNATLGEAFTAPELTNPKSVAVTYASSNTGVAAVNATTGAVELVAAGTTTITASFAGNESYKKNSASYDLVVKAPAALAAPVITTQPTSATYDLNATVKNLAVEATGNPEPTYQWYSNTTNSNENGTELAGQTNNYYKPSTATAGTFYYYCVVTNSEGSATSDVATITVNEPQLASLPFEFDGGRNDIASKDGMSQTGLGTDYASSPKLKFDTQGDNVVINFNEAAKKVTYTIKGNSTSGTYAFDVMESANGVDYTTVHSHTSVDDITSYTDNLKAESRFVKFVYTTKANGNVALGKISIVAASALDDPKLAFSESTYTFFLGDDMQVEAASAAGSAGAVTYALTTGDADAFMIGENNGDIACYTAGTYTVTATIAAAAGFNSGTATCTVKVVEPVIGNSIIVAVTDGGYYAMTTTCEDTYFGHKAIKKAGDKYVVESLDDILFYTHTDEGKTTIQSTSNAQYVQATAAKSIKYTETEYKWTNDGEKLTAATASYGTLQYNTSSPRFTTYASKTGQYATIVDLSNVIVGDVVTLKAKTDDGYYATFSSDKVTFFPNDYVVSAVGVNTDGTLRTFSNADAFDYDIIEFNGKVVTGYYVPANMGVLLYSTDENVIYQNVTDVNPSDDAAVVNKLVPTTADGIFKAEADGNYYYKLAYGDNTNKTKLGFWWGAEDGSGNFKVKAGGAVLCVPQSAGVKGFSLSGGDETVIENLMSNNKQKTIYNLQGVKLQKLQKGVNIVNGRKVIR